MYDEGRKKTERVVWEGEGRHLKVSGFSWNSYENQLRLVPLTVYEGEGEAAGALTRLQ